MNTKTLSRIAMIAAVYTALSLALAPLSYGNIQVRIAEALTLLPLLYKPSIWGLTLGCFLTNLIGAMLGVNPTGYMDAIIGTCATLMAALMTYRLKDIRVKGVPVPSILMPVLFNGVIVGAELAVLYFEGNKVLGTLIMGGEVAVGELIAVVLGWFLIKVMDQRGLFKNLKDE